MNVSTAFLPELGLQADTRGTEGLDSTSLVVFCDSDFAKLAFLSYLFYLLSYLSSYAC